VISAYTDKISYLTALMEALPDTYKFRGGQHFEAMRVGATPFNARRTSGVTRIRGSSVSSPTAAFILDNRFYQE
jgi:hypothetical protein